jgi:predicted membrane protein
MHRIINFLNEIFNLKKKKHPYSSSQILGMFAILFFLFPIIFNIFGYFAIPFAYMTEFIFEPKSSTSVFYWKLSFMTLRLLLGFVSGIWICKMVWPKRKTILSEIKKEENTNQNIADNIEEEIEINPEANNQSIDTTLSIDVGEIYNRARILSKKIKK